MTVSEHLMRPGNWSISFTSDLPVRVSSAILAMLDENNGGTGAHIVITPTPVDAAAVGASALLNGALYTGRIMKRPSRLSLEGEGIGSWLDSYNDAPITRTAGTAAQWLGDLLINGLSAGTVTATGTSNVTQTFPAHLATRRELLDTVAGLGDWEYRVNPNFTVDAAVASTLFQSPPAGIVTRRPGGKDATLRGFKGSMLDQGIDVSRLDTKAVALAEGQGVSIAKGTATAARSLLTYSGGTPELVTVFSAPGEAEANADTAAQNVLNLQGMRREISVSTSTHRLPDVMRPGDELYVYDLPSGIVDLSNQDQYEGEPVFPALVRTLSMNWPIAEGYGVFIRSNAATPEIIDVTDWVAWETGDTWWTVGDWSPANYGRINRTAPEIEERVSNQTDRVQQVGSTDIGPFGGTITDIVTAPSITVPAGMAVRISGQVSFSVDAAGNRVALYVREGSTTLAQSRLVIANAGTAETINVLAVIAPSAGAHTYKLSAQRVTGSGNVTSQGASLPQSVITVELFGAA